MRRRSGFTLVEVLVSMALHPVHHEHPGRRLHGRDPGRQRLQGRRRPGGKTARRLGLDLSRDLEADHFTDGPQASVRLSDPAFWTRLSSPNPPKGFFRIYQQTPDVSEGVDLDGIPSFYQPSTVLHYTIALHGIRRSDFLSAVVPVNSPLTTLQSPTPSTSDVLLLPVEERDVRIPSTYTIPSWPKL